MKVSINIIFIYFLCTLIGCVQNSQPEVGSINSSVFNDSSNYQYQEHLNQPEVFDFGRPVTEAEMALWNTDVRPDGTGLPLGQGTAVDGELIFLQKCMVCHGLTGREGPFDKLVGIESGLDFDFGKDKKLVKTVGNYWPYATTLYDYIQRAMPQNVPGTLSPEEVYKLTAYILFLNEIIIKDFVIDSQSLPGIKMPARDRFISDSRKGGNEIL